jgi:hypothetical protein
VGRGAEVELRRRFCAVPSSAVGGSRGGVVVATVTADVLMIIFIYYCRLILRAASEPKQ